MSAIRGHAASVLCLFLVVSFFLNFPNGVKFHTVMNRYLHEGHSHTKDHQFGFEATPLDKGRTFIHLRYSYSYSSWGYLLMKIFGGGKIGFSVISTDSDGNPVYVDGLRGAVERDVVCYYLAILAYLDTLKLPAEQRFEKRVSQWYDLAGRYKKQLFEMEKEEYLTYKRQDRESQQQLQSDLNR